MRIPRHVAIIMDGNGRWAARRSRPRFFGHVRGSARVKAIVREADRLGVQALTLYAFSTENWNRPESELNILWRLLKKFLVREREELKRENVRMHVIGELERLPDDVRKTVLDTVEYLSDNSGLRLTFAISYGSRKELVRATRLFADDCVKGRCQAADLTEELLESYLWTRDLGELSDVDLVIRTSGEQRVSNYLLWQAAYAEFFFTDLCWPDFEPKHLAEAIDDYGLRDRRFGRVSSVAAPRVSP